MRNLVAFLALSLSGVFVSCSAINPAAPSVTTNTITVNNNQPMVRVDFTTGYYKMKIGIGTVSGGSFSDHAELYSLAADDGILGTYVTAYTYVPAGTYTIAWKSFNTASNTYWNTTYGYGWGTMSSGSSITVTNNGKYRIVINDINYPTITGSIVNE